MELKIGTQLTLEPTYTERSEKFRCRVVEKIGNIIFIDYPINLNTNKIVFLIDGAQYRAFFLTDTKENYCFHTEVLGRKGGNVQTIMLTCPPKDEFVKIQRRQYVRVNTPVDIAITFEERNYQFVAEDISAGGTAIFSKAPFPFKEGDEVQLLAVFPFSNGDIHYVETKAIIVRIIEREEMRIASIRFTDTDETDQQHIVRFCFERQVLIRKKELNEL